MINLDNAALLIIDVQAKLVPLIREHLKLVKKINLLLNIFSKLELPILLSEQYPIGLGKTVSEINANSAKILKNEKTTFSCWKNLDFKKNLSKISKKQLILCGIETHICVLQTCLDLINNSFEVFVAEDAVNSRNEKSHLLGIERMRSSGINIVSVEMVLFELLGNSKHKDFKELSKLIR